MADEPVVANKASFPAPAAPSPYRLTMYGAIIVLLVTVAAFLNSNEQDTAIFIFGAVGVALLVLACFFEIKKNRTPAL